MKISVKKIFVLGLIIFLLIQFYQPARNLDYGQVLPTHFNKIYAVPSDVESILRASCYDCHSNNTEYPWYSYIQPARIILDNHIKEGKENLNFSTFGDYSQRKQGNKVERIVKQIKSDEMPLATYTRMHKNAILSQENKRLLITWMENTRDNMSTGF